MTGARDTFGRPLRSLRLSVTDRCNLRCAYCMPEPDYVWLPNPEILSFEELSALVDRFIALGVNAVRLTGGEPLVRRDLPTLVDMLARKPGLRDLSLTTNGVLLAQQARALKEAGLKRITVSIDTLEPKRFAALTRRDQLDQVLEGIEAAKAARFVDGIKLDTVVMRGVNDDELQALLAFAHTVGAELRFIEYMDVGGATRWRQSDVVSRADLLDRLGPVTPVLERSSAPAERYRRANGQQFGIIASTTAPFCSRCDRARVTADGHFYRCLYATEGLDLKTPLRHGATVSELEATIAAYWSARVDKGAEHRLSLASRRAPLAAPAALKSNPHLEMHTRGG